MRGFAKLVVLGLLRAYKWAISPMIPPACRFVPTCSEYAMEAVERYGATRGGLMALGRLLRCHPLARGGYDPVVRRGPARNLMGAGRGGCECGRDSRSLHSAVAVARAPVGMTGSGCAHADGER